MVWVVRPLPTKGVTAESQGQTHVCALVRETSGPAPFHTDVRPLLAIPHIMRAGARGTSKPSLVIAESLPACESDSAGH